MYIVKSYKEFLLVDGTGCIYYFTCFVASDMCHMNDNRDYFSLFDACCSNLRCCTQIPEFQ